MSVGSDDSSGVRIASTIWADWYPRWNARVDLIDHRRVTGWRFLSAAVAGARRSDALIVSGATGFRQHYRDLVVAALVAKWVEPRPALIVSHATWEPGTRALQKFGGGSALRLRRAARAAVAHLDTSRTRFCVLSSDEERTFPSTWGVDPSRVAFTPFCATIKDRELDALSGTFTGDEPFIFSGGDSLRDHALVAEAARGLPLPVRIATRQRIDSAPPNVHARATSHDEFMQLMATSSAVVTALRPDVRSAGQQTYLNAMALGRPVVVADGPGVTDYIEHGVTGLVTPAGDAAALHDAIMWTLDVGNLEKVAAMTARAREKVLSTYRVRHYLDRLIAVAEKAGALPPTG